MEQKCRVLFSRGFIWLIHRRSFCVRTNPIGCQLWEMQSRCSWAGAVFNFVLSPHNFVLLLLEVCFPVMDRSASVNAEDFQRSDPIGGSLHRGFSNRTVACWLAKCVDISFLQIVGQSGATGQDSGEFVFTITRNHFSNSISSQSDQLTNTQKHATWNVIMW